MPGTSISLQGTRTHLNGPATARSGFLIRAWPCLLPSRRPRGVDGAPNVIGHSHNARRTLVCVTQDTCSAGSVPAGWLALPARAACRASSRWVRTLVKALSRQPLHGPAAGLSRTGLPQAGLLVQATVWLLQTMLLGCTQKRQNDGYSQCHLGDASPTKVLNPHRSSPFGIIGP